MRIGVSAEDCKTYPMAEIGRRTISGLNVKKMLGASNVRHRDRSKDKLATGLVSIGGDVGQSSHIFPHV